VLKAPIVRFFISLWSKQMKEIPDKSDGKVQKQQITTASFGNTA